MVTLPVRLDDSDDSCTTALGLTDELPSTLNCAPPTKS